jgi:hypothetical protein
MRLSNDNNKIILQDETIAFTKDKGIADEIVKRWNMIEGYIELEKAIKGCE